MGLIFPKCIRLFDRKYHVTNKIVLRTNFVHLLGGTGKAIMAIYPASMNTWYCRCKLVTRHWSVFEDFDVANLSYERLSAGYKITTSHVIFSHLYNVMFVKLRQLHLYNNF
jgi:hypothetical protein